MQAYGRVSMRIFGRVHAHVIIMAWLHIWRKLRAGIVAAGHVVPQHAQHGAPFLVLNAVKEALDLCVAARVCTAPVFSHASRCTRGFRGVYTIAHVEKAPSERQAV